MYAKVTQLRDKGRRRREQDIAADVGMRGRIQAFIVEGYPVMHFFEWGSQAVGTADLLFPLYQPQIIGLRDRAMMVRGWQRDSFDADNAATTLQEWAVEILNETPPVTDAPLHGPKPS